MPECQTTRKNKPPSGSSGECGLTEVQRHADEDDQAEPGVEVGDKVDDRNDDVSDGWEDAEHDVAAGGGRSNSLHQIAL